VCRMPTTSISMMPLRASCLYQHLSIYVNVNHAGRYPISLSLMYISISLMYVSTLSLPYMYISKVCDSMCALKQVTPGDTT